MTRESRFDRRLATGTGLFLLGLQTLIACTPAPDPIADNSIVLRRNWQLVPDADLAATPAEDLVGRLRHRRLDGDQRALDGLWPLSFAQGEFEDPYFARNLETIPTEQFAGPWWYRTEFTLDAPVTGGAWLVFEGINYSAEIWLNGQQIGSREDVFGAFRMFEINVADHLTTGLNALAVRVHPPQPGDPTIGFVDWNPRPPDRNMGLWREVRLRLNDGIALNDVFVRADVDLDTLAKASLTIHATARNETDRPVKAVVAGLIGDDIEVEHAIELAAGETRQLEFSPADFPQLRIDQPRLWWPHDLGEPHLYNLDLSVTADGRHQISRASPSASAMSVTT